MGTAAKNSLTWIHISLKKTFLFPHLMVKTCFKSMSFIFGGYLTANIYRGIKVVHGKFQPKSMDCRKGFGRIYEFEKFDVILGYWMKTKKGILSISHLPHLKFKLEDCCHDCGEKQKDIEAGHFFVSNLFVIQDTNRFASAYGW